MTPGEWGPFIWHLIHNIAFLIPSDEYFINYKQYYINFFYCLKKIIPCPICRNHYNKLIDRNSPMKCNNKQSLIQWTIDIHNNVNSRLGKQDMTLEDALKQDFIPKNIYKGLDIIAFNVQYNTPINHYGAFFDSLRVVFPIVPVRMALIKAMSDISIQVRNHRDLQHWYRLLGQYIASSIKG